jgi:UDP-GlcNAc:undecaprenyl-phosphate GlcNAc-1-phosphate transferase
MVGAGLLFLLGFGDDLVRLNSQRKLQAQIGIVIVSYCLGLRLDTLPSFSGTPVHLPWGLSLPLTVLWLTGWTNAMNLIDGLDGLATGIAMIGMAFLAVLGPEHGMAWGICGAAAGFLCFNFPRARMFLGDGGAYLLGFLFGALALMDSAGRGVPFLVTALAVPLLDTIFAFGRRAWRGLPVMKGDAEHVHHQLRALGWNGTTAVLALHGITVLSGMVAWWALHLPGGGWLGLVWVTLAAGGGLGYILHRPAVAPEVQNSSAKPASSSVVGSDTVSSSST